MHDTLRMDEHADLLLRKIKEEMGFNYLQGLIQSWSQNTTEILGPTLPDRMSESLLGSHLLQLGSAFMEEGPPEAVRITLFTSSFLFPPGTGRWRSVRSLRESSGGL